MERKNGGALIEASEFKIDDMRKKTNKIKVETNTGDEKTR